MSDTGQQDKVSAQDPIKPEVTPVAPVPPSQAFDWTQLIIGGVTALAALLATSSGLYVGGGIAVIVGIASLIAKSMWGNYQFEVTKTDAGSKTGQEASDDQQKVNDNRDAIDDFLNQDRRS